MMPAQEGVAVGFLVLLGFCFKPLMMMLDDIQIRPIERGDNAAIARIIRNSLVEFGAAKPGTVFYDDSTDHLFELFQRAGCAYFIAHNADGVVLGGGGIFATDGLPEGTAELVKLYLLPETRGMGLGKKMILLCEETARSLGYQLLYLETMPELRSAIPLYEKLGYSYRACSLGNSGHCGCDVWMEKPLT